MTLKEVKWAMDNIIGPWSFKAADRLYHNHRLDFTAFKGLMRRLPDRTLVYASEYEERLRRYEAQLKAKSEPADDGKG